MRLCRYDGRAGGGKFHFTFTKILWLRVTGIIVFGRSVACFGEESGVCFTSMRVCWNIGCSCDMVDGLDSFVTQRSSDIGAMHGFGGNGLGHIPSSTTRKMAVRFVVQCGTCGARVYMNT